MRVHAFVACCLLALAAVTATGQNAVPSRVGPPLATAEIDRPASLLNQWAELYFSGNWSALQTTIREDLKEADFATLKDTENAFNLGKRPYSVVFITTARKRDGEIIRVLLQPKAPAPYSTTLPGLRMHYELHVKAAKAETLATTYFSTPTDDPVASQLAAFVKQFDPKLLAALFPPFAAAPERSTFFVDMRRVDLPFPRAKIDIEDEATTAASFVQRAERLRTDAVDLAKSLRDREARGIPCATKVVSDLNSRIDVFVDAPIKTVADLTPHTSACGTPTDAEKQRLATEWDFLQRELGCVYAYAVQTPTCTTTPATPVENALLVQIETRYRELARGGGAKIAGKTAYANVPSSAVSLGVIAGIITSVPGEHNRYKLSNDGKLTLDPLTGAISVAAVNIHPRRFNPASAALTAGERYRLFIGPILSPEFGLAAGGGVAIIRGLSVNAGYGIVRINTLRHGDAAGAAPADKSRPFRNSTAGVVFFGLGYNFK